jgi:hypothetical protein
MLLKLMEIYEEVVHHNKAEGQKYYHIREVVINKEYITFMREDPQTSVNLKDGRLPSVLDKEQKFTRISVARGNIGQDIIVIGDLQSITSLFNQDMEIVKKKTLKG